MKFFLAILVATTAISPAWGQTATVVPAYPTWSDLGTGVVLLVSHGAGRASYAVTANAVAPSLAPELGFPVPVDRSQSINPPTSDHVWVSAISALQVTVTYAQGVAGQ